jgi:hypothetical protein
MGALHTFARVAAVALGILLVYLATFLYETTENRIQNRLEDFWLSLEYDKRTPISIARRLTRAVILVADRLFERLFDGRELSATSICVAWCFAVAGMVFSFFPLFLFAWLADVDPAGISKALVLSLQVLTIAGLIAFAIGLLPAVHRSLRWITYGAVAAQVVSLGLLLWLIRARPEAKMPVEQYGVTGTVLALAVNLSYGIVVVHMFRYGVHALATGNISRRRLRLVVGTFIVTLFAFAANAFVATVARHPQGRLAAWIAGLLQRPSVMFVLYPLAGPMSLWAFALVGFVVLASLVLLHVWLWPVIRFVLMRTTYAAQRHQLIRQHVKLRAAGYSLVAFAIGERIVAWIKNFKG